MSVQLLWFMLRTIWVPLALKLKRLMANMRQTNCVRHHAVPPHVCQAVLNSQGPPQWPIIKWITHNFNLAVNPVFLRLFPVLAY